MTATILKFPKRNKGRVRKTESMFAAGEMSFGFLGIKPPDDIAILDTADREAVCAEDTTALLAIALFATATDEMKRQVRTQVAYAKKAAPTRHKRQIAARLQEMLG